MPLPYAPPPKESKVYRDLKNLKVSEITADQLDTLKEAVYAQGIDGAEDELRRLKLLGEVSNQNSSAGPIPGSMKITTTEITYAETGAATGYKTIFVPQKGEVWQFLAASSAFSGGSSGQSIIMGDSEPADLTTPPTTYVLVAQESSTGNPTWSPLIYGADLYFDENIIPVLQSYSQTTGESSIFYGAFIRVR
jgi:hypothetical protein